MTSWRLGFAFGLRVEYTWPPPSARESATKPCGKDNNGQSVRDSIMQVKVRYVCGFLAVNVSSTKLASKYVRLGLKAAGCLLTMVLLAVIATLIVLTFFALSETEQPFPHSIPLPVLPNELSALPARAEIRCSNTVDPVAAGDFIDVYMYPGLVPETQPRSNSLRRRYVADHGREVGKLPRCIEVVASTFAWSEISGKFYDYVEQEESSTPQTAAESWSRIRSQQAPGWVHFEQLEFSKD